MQFSMDDLFSIDNTMILAIQEELANTICDTLAEKRLNYNMDKVSLDEINTVIDTFSDESLLSWSEEEIDNFYRVAGY